jgi:hypothetical protein
MIYDMICLTAVGLTPDGSSAVHIYINLHVGLRKSEVLDILRAVVQVHVPFNRLSVMTGVSTLTGRGRLNCNELNNSAL